MESVFLIQNQQNKDDYISIINNVAKAITETFVDGKAYAGPTPQELQKIIEIDELLPNKGLGFDEVFNRLKEKVLPYFLRTPSQNYMAHLHGPSLIETIASELIIATYNQSMDSWDQSPVATEIETVVVKKLCEMFGLAKEGNNPDGVFTSGGSQSNETALLVARDWFCNTVLHHDVKKYGLPENFKKFRLYTSCISHFSMEKSAHMLGLGYECVVKVPVDERKKMDAVALEKLIEDDIAAGNIPFCVVGTVGTTDFGSIDPLDKIAELCKKHNMWFHADAAYGSGVVMSTKYNDRVANLSLCDSITLDFHKMFLMPISCSAVLLANGKNFEALTIHADYLNRTEDEEDGYTNLVDKSIQTTRRFDALKVWVSFQTRGVEGWSNLISTSMENAQYLYSQLAKDSDFDVVTNPEISSVVFRLSSSFCGNSDRDEVNKKVRRSLIHDEGVVIGQTVSNGGVCLKFTLLNPLITHEKLDSLLVTIKELGNKAK